MRPFFPFYGSKWNIARYYPPPTHRRIIEPFAGGAGYATFYGGRDVVLVEKDPIIVGVWRWLLAAQPRDVLALPDLPEVGDSVDQHDLEPGAKWLIGFWLNRGSAQPKKARTAYSARTDRAQLNWGPRAKARLVEQLPLIRGWTVIEDDYSLAPAIEGTWFVDPPYGDKGKYYRVTFSNYAALAPWVLQRRGQVIACEASGASWLPFTPLGSFKSSRGRAEEVYFHRGLIADAVIALA